MPAITPQPSRPAPRASTRGSPSCTARRARASSRRTRRCRARGRAPGPSCSVIFWAALWVEKQYQGSPRRQARHVPSGRAPVEDHEVARRDVGDALADGLDDPGCLVAEEEREVVGDPPRGSAGRCGRRRRPGPAPPPRRGRGPGTMIVSTETGFPFAWATTPRTFCGIPARLLHLDWQEACHEPPTKADGGRGGRYARQDRDRVVGVGVEVVDGDSGRRVRQLGVAEVGGVGQQARGAAPSSGGRPSAAKSCASR